MPSQFTTQPYGDRRRQGPREEYETQYEVPEALLHQEPGTQHFTLDDEDSVPELGGSRPDRLYEVRPQERVQRHAVEQIGDSAPFLPSLDVPVPLIREQLVEVHKLLDVALPEQVIEVPKIYPVDQIVDTAPALPVLDVLVPLMGEQLVDFLRFFDTLCSVAEQVIDVPKIILEDIPARRLCREPQLVGEPVPPSDDFLGLVFAMLIAVPGAGLRTRRGCTGG